MRADYCTDAINGPCQVGSHVWWPRTARKNRKFSRHRACWNFIGSNIVSYQQLVDKNALCFNNMDMFHKCLGIMIFKLHWAIMWKFCPREIKLVVKAIWGNSLYKTNFNSINHRLSAPISTEKLWTPHTGSDKTKFHHLWEKRGTRPYLL